MAKNRKKAVIHKASFQSKPNNHFKNAHRSKTNPISIVNDNPNHFSQSLKKHNENVRLSRSSKARQSLSFLYGNAGSILLVLFAFLILVAVFSRLNDVEYIGVDYWFKVLETTPQIPLRSLFVTIPSLDLPVWLDWIVSPFYNTIIKPIASMLLGCLGALVNVFLVLSHFLLAFLGLLSL